MADPIQQLYSRHVYPPMSHPLADPARTAVAARLAGLRTPDPRRARILEIGCSSGHHLLPLAVRWPESEFIGIDLSEEAIQSAKSRAAASEIHNVRFETIDLREFGSREGEYDFIIAHGFFSWVPDEVKTALLDFCRRNLSLSGIATVSFNVEAGWRNRFPVIEKARAIQQVGAVDLITALEILRSVTESDSIEVAVIDDMLAKGSAILTFDDFAPVNDAWPLRKFVDAAEIHGLRWLGETDPAANVPSELSDETATELAAKFPVPMDFQSAADEVAGRLFRASILCRADAPVDDPISVNQVFDHAYCVGVKPQDTRASEVWQAVSKFSPRAVPLLEAVADFEGWDRREMAAVVFESITSGWLLPRVEPVKFDPLPPEFPRLDPFRLRCAQERLPIVDVWHTPCQFPDAHDSLLSAMDGTRSISELARISELNCPDLNFGPWLRHLAARGMFS